MPNMCYFILLNFILVDLFFIHFPPYLLFTWHFFYFFSFIYSFFNIVCICSSENNTLLFFHVFNPSLKQYIHYSSCFFFIHLLQFLNNTHNFRFFSVPVLFMRGWRTTLSQVLKRTILPSLWVHRNDSTLYNDSSQVYSSLRLDIVQCICIFQFIYFIVYPVFYWCLDNDTESHKIHEYYKKTSLLICNRLSNRLYL